MRHAYGAFNKALKKLYGKQQLYLADTQLPFDFDPDIFEAASRVVYDAGGFDTELLKDQKVRNLIDETLRCLSQAIDNAIPVDVPDTLRYALENNAFVFSGFKTFHAMREVGLSMLTDDGNIKLWPQFRDDVRLLNEHYNTNYLYAEYKHAMGTAQMAVKWQQIEKDGDRYLLQYRTAGDDKVRDEHRLLDGTTLPPSDPFWASYYPPNGWGCRCTAVQVRRDKYPQSDPALAMKRGDNATDGVKQRIFRFNAGKTLQLFPPKHPYYKAPTAAKKIIHELAQRRSDNRQVFRQYSDDPNYNDVQFNTDTYGMKATHKGHAVHTNEQTRYFGLSPNELELACQDNIFRMGHRAILRDESQKRNGNYLPALDLELDGIIMDIRSITAGEHYGNAIMAKHRQLRNVKHKTGLETDALCLYFHLPEMFSEQKLQHDIEWYKRTLQQYEAKQRIHHIYVVVNGAEDIKHYDL